MDKFYFSSHYYLEGEGELIYNYHKIDPYDILVHDDFMLRKSMQIYMTKSIDLKPDVTTCVIFKYAHNNAYYILRAIHTRIYHCQA